MSNSIRFSVFFSFIFFISSCSPVLNSKSTLGNKPCAQITPPAVPQSQQKSSKFIYVLVDKSGSYSEITSKAIDRLTDVLPRVLRPSDRLIVGWIGENRKASVFVPVIETGLLIIPAVAAPVLPPQPQLVKKNLPPHTNPESLSAWRMRACSNW